MGKDNFTEDFKRDAVCQIAERGYLVADVRDPPIEAGVGTGHRGARHLLKKAAACFARDAK